MSTLINLSDTTPPAAPGYTLGKWQKATSPSGTDPTTGAPYYDASVELPNLGGAVVKTANYTAVAADCGLLLSFNSASAVTLTLPAAPPFAQWTVAVQNVGAGGLTVNRNSLNIDGAAANLTLNQGSGAAIFTDGTNYFTERGSGGGFTPGGDLSGTSTSQTVIGLNNQPIDTSVTLQVGMRLIWNGTKWTPEVDYYAQVVSSVAGFPSAGQLVAKYVAAVATTFPANFATPNSYGNCGINPTATASYTVKKNGTTVGTISISTSGVFTFATTGGTTWSVNAGDVVTIIAPLVQDATLQDVGLTLVGYRTGQAPAGSPSPIITWRGAYNGATAYGINDAVSYLGSSYICILPTTGNVPTNTTYWNLLAAAGGAPTFSAITSGTNSTAAMVLGSGSSLTVSGTGTNNATAIDGVTVTGTPSVGQVPTATSGSAATWQNPAGGFSLYPTLTAPISTNFTQLNWSTTTVLDKTSRMVVHGAPLANGNLRVLLSNTSLPATPYTIDLGGEYVGIPGGNFGILDIVLKNSGGNTLVAGGIGFQTGQINFRVDKWTAASTYGSLITNPIPAITQSQMLFVRITDDGTNRRYYLSQNKRDFMLVYTEATNTNVTPDTVGIGFYADTAATGDPIFVVYDFEVTNSILPQFGA